MKYFNGFSLSNEEELFNFWLQNKNKYLIAGFSYGSIKALKYVLNSNKRVDKLVLISPAYFNDRNDAFKKTQLIHFKKDTIKYMNTFLKNISSGSEINLTKYVKIGTIKELEELLTFKWKLKDLKKIAENGTKIEVVLGENDKIINSKEALVFFEQVATVYFIKNANHILKEVKND